MPETWYILEDDSVGDPHEIAPDAKGVLRHKDGRAVAYAAHGPRTRSVDAEAERAKAAKAKHDAEVKATPSEQPPRHHTRGMKAEEPAQRYKTR